MRTAILWLSGPLAFALIGGVFGWGNLLGAITGIAGFTCLRLWATAAKGKGSKQ